MQMTTRHWMYNADRRSNEFIVGVREFLRVAEENKRDSFMCRPCDVCMNSKKFVAQEVFTCTCSSRVNFMPNYIFWTKHGETGVMMEEGEEEQADPDDVFAQYCDFAVEEGEEEADAENTIAEDTMLLVIRDAQRDCKSEKEKAKFDQMLEDHKKLLYSSAEDGQKKLDTTLKLLQWKTENGISKIQKNVSEA